MSRRTGGKNGAVFSAEGGEESPAELDPMGNNAGLTTPYIEEPPVYQPPQDYPMLQPLDGGSPMYVNGQRATCTLDGMAIGCSQAFDMLGHSAAIDLAHTDPWVLGQLGIFVVQRTITGNNHAPPPPGQPDNGGAYGTRDRIETEYYFSKISWAPLDQVQERKLTDREVDRLQNVVNFLLSQEKCAKFVENVLNTANELFPRMGMWSDYLPGMFGEVKTEGGFSFGTSIRKGYSGLPGATSHGSFREGTAAVEFDINQARIVTPVPGTSITQRAADLINFQGEILMGITAIHEIMHLAGFDDRQLMYAVAAIGKDQSVLANGPPSGPLKDLKSEVANASYYWQKRLDSACFVDAKDLMPNAPTTGRRRH